MIRAVKKFILAHPICQQIILKWKNSHLLRAVATMAGGTVFAQALSILASPINTRLFSPSDYGIAAVFSSSLAIILLPTTWRYEMALMLPQDEGEARPILWCCIALSCLTAGVSVLVVLSCGDGLFKLVGAPQLYHYRWMLPPTILGGSLYQSLSVWALRRKAYAALSGTKVRQAVIGTAVTITVGSLWNGPLGLLLGSACWMCMGVTRLCRGSQLFEKKTTIAHVTSRMLHACKSYGSFAFLTTMATLLGTGGMTIAPMLFSAFYSQDIVGHFSLAQRVIFLPGALVGTAVAQVFIAEGSEILRERPAEMPHFFRKVTRKMAPFVVGLLIIGLICPWAFPLAFGARWKTAGIFAAMLSVLAAVQMIVSPIGDITVLRRRQGIQAGLGIARIVAVVASITLPALFGQGPLVAVGVYTVSVSLVNVVSFFFYQRMARHIQTPPPPPPAPVPKPVPLAA